VKCVIILTQWLLSELTDERIVLARTRDAGDEVPVSDDTEEDIK
jgi:hypothetical protein